MEGRILTTDQLKKADVCRSTIALFARKFGKSAIITEAWAIKNAPMFEWGCAAGTLLSGANLAEFAKQRTPHRAEYHKRRAPHWTEYAIQCAIIRAEYEEHTASHRAEIQKQDAINWAECANQCDPYWAECQIQCAAIFAKLYISEGVK